MRAILCKQWGAPDNLVLDEIASPRPGPGQVRISVKACGLNYADLLMIAGKYQVRPKLPFSPGFEVAGEVMDVGPGVSGFRAGDRVLANALFGGYAEEIVVPQGGVNLIPDAMDFVTAASFLIAYGTSHLALTHRAGLRAGETLLVHGASGGVGLTAVEIGKQLGATVIATASSAEKLALCKQYGADHLINYRAESFRDRVRELTDGKGADVIYDPVGGDVFDESMRCIAWEGRLLVIGFASGRIPQAPANLVLVKNFSVVGFFWGAYQDRDPESMQRSNRELLEWYQEGRLQPHVSRTFPLEQAAEALNEILQRRATGRIVLLP